ncbi:MAG: hypothetical protein E7058_03000 [Lentisphaerae bacterium]|nr:hypothetical protein [Lentisphaerota bacterium]
MNTMKRSLFFTAILLAIAASGCYNPHSLDRTPQPKRQTVKKKTVQKPKKKKGSDDPLFDAIFHRNPQNYDAGSKLSKREQELLREYDIRNERTVKEMHDNNRKSNMKGSDWVFGTDNGSFF